MFAITATLNAQKRMGMASQSLFLAACLVVLVTGKVAAFQTNNFAVPTKSLSVAPRIGYSTAGRYSPYSIRQRSLRSHDVHSSRLSMAGESGINNEKSSKRKRFKESIKKMLSYPKVCAYV